ncbi:MAG: diguanylate cyclase [Gemmatimonadota bacterium]
MRHLCSPEHFSTILEFASGIADRGVPLSLVLVEPDGWADSPTAEAVEALEALARKYLRHTRRSDRMTRLSSVRYAVLLVDCNRQGAMLFADRLQAVTAGPPGGVTISCGIATWGPDMESHEDLVTAAARALRRAQSGGGNGIEPHVARRTA